MLRYCPVSISIAYIKHANFSAIRECPVATRHVWGFVVTQESERPHTQFWSFEMLELCSSFSCQIP